MTNKTTKYLSTYEPKSEAEMVLGTGFFNKCLIMLPILDKPENND